MLDVIASMLAVQMITQNVVLCSVTQCQQGCSIINLRIRCGDMDFTAQAGETILLAGQRRAHTKQRPRLPLYSTVKETFVGSTTACHVQTWPLARHAHQAFMLCLFSESFVAN